MRQTDKEKKGQKDRRTNRQTDKMTAGQKDEK